MARKKNREPERDQAPVAAPEAEAQTPAKDEKQDVSKTDAVKQALTKLGNRAKPKAIQAYVKDTFGLEMSASYVSNIKSTLGKKKGKGKRGRPKKAAPMNGKPTVAEVREPRVKPAARKGMGLADIALDDIQTVKDLAKRLGIKSLKALVDLVAK